MSEKLRVKISKEQLLKLAEYTLPYRKKMKKMDPNNWDTGIFVMAGIYQEVYLKAAVWGLLEPGETKALPLADIEWFVLAHELLRYCPEQCLNDLLVDLDKLLERKWRYNLYGFKRKHLDLYHILSNINQRQTEH